MLASVFWTGGGDASSWDDADNWQPGVPTAGDDVIINATAGTERVRLASAAPAQLNSLVVDVAFDVESSLELTGDGPFLLRHGVRLFDNAQVTGDGDLYIGDGVGADELLWSGGSMSGAGTTIIGSSIGAGVVASGRLARALQVQGRLTADQLRLGDSQRVGDIHVGHGGELLITGSGIVRADPVDLREHAIVVLPGGTLRQVRDDVQLVDQSSVAIINHGLVSLAPGVLTVNGRFEQTARGQLTFELAPEGHAMLAVRGLVRLNGVTGIQFSNAFDPSSGDRLNLLQSQSTLEGDAPLVFGNTLPDGRELVTQRGARSIGVVVVDQSPIEDPFEPNNLPNQATFIGTGDRVISRLGLTPDDADWFRWVAPRRGQLSVGIEFTHETADLELQIFSPELGLLEESSTVSDHERVNMPVQPDQEVFIRVIGYENTDATNYRLTLQLGQDLPRIYVATEAAIRVFDFEGRPIPRETISHPTLDVGRLGDVEIGPNGRIYVSQDVGRIGGFGGRILEFTPDGLLMRVIPVPLEDAPQLDFAYPNGFDVLRDGSLLLAQPNARRIVRIRPTGRVIDEPQPIPLQPPIDVGILSSGEVVWSPGAVGAVSQPMLNVGTHDVYSLGVADQPRFQLRDGFGNILRERRSRLTLDPQVIYDGTVVMTTVGRDGDGSRLSRMGSDGRHLFQVPISGRVGGLAVNYSERPADPPDRRPDRDADGIPDEWERNGVDINEDGIIDLDLASLGASPDYKDIFVEVDAMQGRSPSSSDVSLPSVEAAGLSTHTVLDRVVEAFLSSPVPNPSGETGVRLHLIMSDDEIPVPNEAWSGWQDFNQTKAEYFGTPDERSDPNWEAIRVAKARVFRYAVFADQIQGSTASGAAELGGNDFFVSLGAWPIPGGTQRQQAGTFMHELGHTLGLRDGGGDEISYKPNYLSVMNYHWQVPTGNGGWSLDYARTELPPLDEANLNESRGIGFPASESGMIANVSVQVGPEPLQHVALVGAIDWSRDDQDEDGRAGNDRSVAADINWVSGDADDASPGQLLRSHHDWANLKFSFDDQHESPRGLTIYFSDDTEREFAVEDTERLDDDAFGGNDSMESAEELGERDVKLLELTIPPGDDDDWFQWVASVPGEVTFAVTQVESPTSLTMSLYDADGNALQTSTVDTVGQISHPVVAGEALALQVSQVANDQSTAFYTLSVDGPDLSQPTARWTGAGDGYSWNDAQNWMINSAIVAAPTTIAPGDEVMFEAAASIQVDGVQRARSLVFAADVEIAGGVVQLDSGSIDVNSGQRAVVTSRLEALALRKLGAGELIVDDFQGVVQLEAGAMQGAGVWQSLDVADGATLTLVNNAPLTVTDVSDVHGVVRILIDGEAEVAWETFGPLTFHETSQIEIHVSGPLADAGSWPLVLIEAERDPQNMPTVGNLPGQHQGYGVFFEDASWEDAEWEVRLWQAFAGDANGDRRFDSEDIVHVFQAGRYNVVDDRPTDWTEGDWTGDGVFDAEDLVQAFIDGHYVSESPIRPALPVEIAAAVEAIEQLQDDDDRLMRRRRE